MDIVDRMFSLPLLFNNYHNIVGLLFFPLPFGVKAVGNSISRTSLKKKEEWKYSEVNCLKNQIHNKK
jgi:hypothetical protein